MTFRYCFGTIRNNTALKLDDLHESVNKGFGTIRNNTALKHVFWLNDKYLRFWDHSKQHSSKTTFRDSATDLMFWDHSKQHSSKTESGEQNHVE